MIEYKLHSVESAPEELRQTLSDAQTAYGFLPNLYGVMSHAPALMQGYLNAYKLFAQTTLSSVEQQVVLIAISFENTCTYCVSVHSAVAKMEKVADDVIDAIRNGTPISDPKLESLRRFTQTMVSSRGRPSSEELDGFLSAGYGQENVLEIILAIGVKTMSNYTNHIANTPLDKEFAGSAWSA